MTNDIELLPLPDWMECLSQIGSEDIRDYARACVAHATAAKDAEIEALRAEVERWKVLDLEWLNKTEWVQQTGRPSELGRHRADVMRMRLEQVESSAERMAEALRLYMATGVGNSTDFYKQVEAKRAAQAALHPTAEQENDDA